MDRLEKINGAMDYIENNITWVIDYEQIAKIVGCPYFHFQRMFAFITGLSLSEYIRRRRLTLAAVDLQQSDESVIEIAQKYGYDSHSTFSRAFKDLHDITPIAARKLGTKLKAYPRMTFHISIAGGMEINYRVEKRTPFSVVGVKYPVKTEASFTAIPKIRREIWENGIAHQLLALTDSGSVPGDVMGILSAGQWDRIDEFYYYTVVPYEHETPNGLERISIPEGQWAVIDAPTRADIPMIWRHLFLDRVPMFGYSLVNLPVIEYYHLPGSNPRNELWIPVAISQMPS